MRDKGVCRACGLDTLDLRRRLYDFDEETRESMGLALGFPAYQARKLMLWEADHTVPVSQGGGVERGDASVAGITAFQTLCVRCHIQKSTQERARDVTEPP
jgi:hypothetical protein